MSQPPQMPSSGGWVQPAPGAPPVPVGAPYPVGAPHPGGVPSPGEPPYGQASIPASGRARTLGVVALVVAILGIVVSVPLSSATGFAAAEGAMSHAIDRSPAGLEDFTQEQLLALLTPVRGIVLWAEIGFWTGTVVGVAALGLGITAIVTRRGRGQGVAAVVVAALGPILFAIIVAAAVIAGIAAAAP